MEIKTYYEFILAQFAAESYWDNLYGTEAFDITNILDRAQRLENGANRYDKINEFTENDFSPTQMTTRMISDFENIWEIVTHLPNQISGFSATLLQNKNTGEYSLSFRGTEFKDEEDGGDSDRDLSGADFQIFSDGFSLAQIEDM